MSIQTDILDTIGDGGIEVAALRGKLGNVGANELDCAVNALLRARRLQISFGRYELIPSTRLVGQMPTRKPPSAEEEAAASLLPATRVCVTCKGEPQELHQFRHVGPGEKRSNECNGCWRKRARVKRPVAAAPRTLADIHVTAPVVIHSARRQESVNGGSGETLPAASAVEPTHQQGSVNLPDGAKPSPTSSAIDLEARRVNAPLGTTSKPVVIAPQGNSGESPASHSVFDRVTLQRQAGLNKIALLEVELANARAYVAERERFLEMWERFAQGAV